MKNFLEKSQISSEMKAEIASLDADFSEILEKMKEISDNIVITHEIRPKILGKDGIITKLMGFIRTIDAQVKKEYAQIANEMKNFAEAQILSKMNEIEAKEMENKLKNDKIDETLPSINKKTGSLHIITKTSDEIIKILGKFGFILYDGPEIDTCDNNFTKLNIPESHPARQMHDTFYINSENGEKNTDYILRTHTSNVQIHAMNKEKSPIRGISFGKVFRFDSDATHSPMFHQIECFCVDENVTMANMIFTINAMLSDFFETDVKVRLRPSFFPFTSPSAEIDIPYVKLENGIKIQESSTFLEIGGCGMIHDEVLKNCNIDEKKYQGFAFGFGVDRMAMLKYGAPDIRKFYNTSMFWMKNYNFNHFDV
ncbi:phenylalanine--tRNA ligase subunit alpha [Candidatus Deianiraea vastatrix]|uniref:Phenylalanine--tRNA ligase alpha subunit n=1 Tax=Candidatus Deianiraea vastatrix TaxID=2163644 RepID=A0A5B8XER3_9RICK|nr:phenylalanine--tRNA ligase subunit alpha [Candidatus Deianiraea vastatrix]QED23456.1 Phenylalanine--tRNA ligase alpha subunit [Candidatus Deianiraea vastatrix]